MEILVINLMRLGDLIQASPVLRRLRVEYPQSYVTLMVMDIFKEPALLLDGVDRLILFPSLTLITALEEKGGWPEAYQVLRAWFAEHLSPPPDVVVNLTPNLLGAILSSAIGGRKLFGFAADTLRGGFTFPAWASYGLVVSKARQANPFNLVDMFVRGAGLTPDGAGLHVVIPRKIQSETDAAIQALALAPGTSLVGILPGASQPERQWPPENFARTARILRQTRPCHFFVLGSSQEAPLGEVIKSQLPAGAVTQCQGHTSLAVLAAHLNRLDLLITNDTGPMHLAAAVGTPVLALFLASARVQDTGPAGKGHIAIEPELNCHPCLAPCSHPCCHAVITPEVVAEWGLHLLTTGKVHHLIEASDHRNLRLYYSDIDSLKYQVYLPLVRRSLERRDFWQWIHRMAWIEILDSPVLPDSWRVWVKETLARHYLPSSDDPGIKDGQGSLAELLNLASQGEDTARQIVSLAESVPTAAVRLQQKVEVFAAIDLQLKRLAVAFPELASLIEFFFQEQRRQDGDQIIPLALSLIRAYSELHRIGTIFLNVVQELSPQLVPSLVRECFEVAQEMQTTSNTSRNYRQDLGWRHAGDYQ